MYIYDYVCIKNGWEVRHEESKQPLSHSTRVAAPATQPLSHTVKSDWTTDSATQSVYQSGKFLPTRTQSYIYIHT